MRPIYFDDGTRFDDPNAYWGDGGSYVLEPGDAGFVIPPPAPSIPKPKSKKMSSNATPDSRAVLTALARQIHAGQVTHQASVGLLHHLAAGMDAAIKKLEGDPAAASGSAANKGSQLVYRSCVSATSDAKAALVEKSDGDVRLWLLAYRRLIATLYGESASADWQTAGFPAGKTKVPENHAARQSLLTAARAFLAANAAYEITYPQPGGGTIPVTAARALTLQGEMQAAFTLINTREAEQELCKDARDADVKALYKEVSETIAELRDLLEDDDARWELFGLNIPANPNPPQGVTSLTLTPAGPARALAAWTYAVRAEYYRLFLQRIGIDADFVNLADPKDLEYTLKDLTAGTLIKVYIVPMNEGGAGPASPVAELTV